MSTVEDQAGNNPVALDPAITRHDKVSSVEFRGATQELLITTSPVQSTAFGNLTRFIRIAPSGASMYYDIGSAPDAENTAKRSFLAENAVESVPVRPGEFIDVDQFESETGIASITEDK